MTYAISSATPELTEHFDRVLEALSRGRMVFFLGAGANGCDREGMTWNADEREFLPTAGELAGYLSDSFGVGSGDLARVAQHAALRKSGGLLYLQLRDLLNVDYPLTRLHKLLAGLPLQLRSSGSLRTDEPHFRRLVFISTNYDDLLERALGARGEPHHVLVYQAQGPEKGLFLHLAPDGSATWIRIPNQYEGLLIDEHPLVMKFHGSIDRKASAGDSYVITEDHYIEYLMHTEAELLIPAPLPAMFRECGFLFLGHGLRDWNLRVLLQRIWTNRTRDWPSWAIQKDVDPLERKHWSRRGIDIIDSSLAHYVSLLGERLATFPSDARSTPL